ncbi:MAG: type II secretion system GspH family protein [Gemmatimonadota bacterium]|nr:type II secretion system GspH family protein [Gemmatimonadota bacterium]
MRETELPHSAMRPRRFPGQRKAITLLELIAVMAVMGVILALAAPAFVVPSPSPADQVQQVVTSVRRAALRRGESMSLEISASGIWNAWAPSRSGVARMQGKIDSASTAAMRLRISPVGVCVVESVLERIDAGRLVPVYSRFDPLTCSLRDSSP